MTKNIVIVESPTKAKTITKYLGKDYHVLASYGHIRDLPAKNGSVNPDEDFDMVWELDARGNKQVKDILTALNGADHLYLATDPDREGEAISWHVQQVLNQKKAIKNIPTHRIVFYEVTQKAIKAALEQPRDLNEGLIQAYLARRALDYLVGFTLSPVLWRKLPGSRSAGRVQSVALRLITDRESEIEAFISQEYWTLDGLFQKTTGAKVQTRLVVYQGKKLEKFDIQTEANAAIVKETVSKGSYHVASIEKKQVKRHPTPPFITSTLQQEASRKCRFTAKKTMQLAQQLYEGIDIGGETVGLITYMRTDSVQVSQDALHETRQFIQKTYGAPYLPGAPRAYKSKSKNAQEAHEAIRPTQIARTPEQMRSHLQPDQLKVYELIWKRMVASQMESALFDQLSVQIASADNQHQFRATGSTLVFDGFLKLYEEGQDDAEASNEQAIPPLTQDEPLSLKQVTPEQHFTQPPPRYSEATLVKKLEELGIGRPSTYASIMSTLLDRKYVHMDKKQLVPEPLGRVVTSFLINYFKTYVEYDFTANLEEKLDEIAEGSLNWKKVLQDFWTAFKQAVDQTKDLRVGDVIDQLNVDLEKFLFSTPDHKSVSRLCPQCQKGQLSLKLGKFGAFVGCSEYPTCPYTRKLLDQTTEDQEGAAQSEAAPTTEPRIVGKDPETGHDISVRKGPYGFYLQWEGSAVAPEPAPVEEAPAKKSGKKKAAKPKAPKPKRVAIPRGVDPMAITLEQALNLGMLPKSLGVHPETKAEMVVGIGRFGPYIRHEGTFTSIPKSVSFLTITLEEAVNLIKKKAAKK